MAKLTFSEFDKWDSIETSSWTCMPLLGENWFGRWISSLEGFKIMISDGVHLWGEIQNTSYITEKAKHWAICIEGDANSLSKEILNQLEKQTGTLTCKQEGSSLCIMELSACLEGLPYKWIFNLSLLPPVMVYQYFTYPLASAMKRMEMRVRALETELKRRERQLQDLDPKYQPISDLSCDTPSLIASSIKSVTEMGLGTVLCKNKYFNHGMLVKLSDSMPSYKNANLNSNVEKDISAELTSVTPSEHTNQKSLSNKHEITSNLTQSRKKARNKLKI